VLHNQPPDLQLLQASQAADGAQALQVDAGVDAGSGAAQVRWRPCPGRRRLQPSAPQRSAAQHGPPPLSPAGTTAPGPAGSGPPGWSAPRTAAQRGAPPRSSPTGAGRAAGAAASAPPAAGRPAAPRPGAGARSCAAPAAAAASAGSGPAGSGGRAGGWMGGPAGAREMQGGAARSDEPARISSAEQQRPCGAPAPAQRARAAAARPGRRTCSAAPSSSTCPGAHSAVSQDRSSAASCVSCASADTGQGRRVKVASRTASSWSERSASSGASGGAAPAGATSGSSSMRDTMGSCQASACASSTRERRGKRVASRWKVCCARGCCSAASGITTRGSTTLASAAQSRQTSRTAASSCAVRCAEIAATTSCGSCAQPGPAFGEACGWAAGGVTADCNRSVGTLRALLTDCCCTDGGWPPWRRLRLGAPRREPEVACCDVIHRGAKGARRVPSPAAARRPHRPRGRSTPAGTPSRAPSPPQF
jgi:hypothetical protein